MIKRYRIPLTGTLTDRKGGGKGDVHMSSVVGFAIGTLDNYTVRFIQADWAQSTVLVTVDTGSAAHAAISKALPQGTSTNRLSAADKAAIFGTSGETGMIEKSA